MVGGLFLLAAIATATRAAEPKDWSVWSRVPKFRGYATVVTKYDTERAIGLANGRETGFEVEMTSVRFVLERARPFHAEQMTWVMTTGEVAFQSLFGQKFQNDLGESSEVFQHAEYRGPPRDPHETSLTIEANSGRWQFVTPSHAAEQYTVISNVDNRRGDTAEQYTQTWKQDTIENAVFEAVAPRLLAPLVNQDTADRSRPEPGGKTTGSKEQRIQLFPDFDDVEVESSSKDTRIGYRGATWPVRNSPVISSSSAPCCNPKATRPNYRCAQNRSASSWPRSRASRAWR